MSEVIFSSFLLVAVSEMGDKTQLLAFSLSARFKKPGWVMAGIFVATVLNHTLASTLGQWISNQIQPRIMTLILGVVFIGFGLWTLVPDQIDENSKPSRFGPFLTTAILFFLAEMGDKTQLATVALAARFQSAFGVTLGTTLGMLFSDGIAVWIGEKLADKVQMKWVRYVAAGLFFIFGIGSLITGINGF